MVDDATMRERVQDARVGRLATVTDRGLPHAVPCCFALDGDLVYSAVDTKPKATTALRRLANLRANPAAALLVDHYSEEWAELWWVRLDGRGRILEGGAEHDRAIARLATKYQQYRETPPPGPAIVIDVTRWTAWP
jgi:PPOX class probable F420-dependent enzyme